MEHMEHTNKKRKIRNCTFLNPETGICCETGARSGFDKCIKHGGGKKCSVLNSETGACCETAAVDGFDKCHHHGGFKKCNVLNSETGVCCETGARKGFDKCIKHGGGKKCSVEECKTSAQPKSNKCIKHGGGKKCSVEKCETSAHSGFDTCSKHGGSKKCIINECKNYARDGSGKCSSHGGGKRCPNCIDWPDSRSGDKKYDGYCATCFKRLFPDDPRSKVIHENTKEIQVRNFINEHFDGFVHDKPLYTGNCDCTHRRRVDHRKLINETVLAIETDEFGHRSYDEHDEEIRYDDLYMIHSGKWIFIRFNPDDNYDKTDIEDKLEILLETMKEQIDRIEQGENTEPLEIIKLFC